MTWPFPPFPNPIDKGNKVPKFNPDNHEDAPCCAVCVAVWQVLPCVVLWVSAGAALWSAL